MLLKRCFICGRRMADNGLCSNTKCIRSEPVSEKQTLKNNTDEIKENKS